MAEAACQSNIPPGGVICTENHCGTYRQSSVMKQECKCLRWDDKPIPDCTPRGANFPVETGECYNSQTGQREVTTMQTCLDRRDKDRNWSWRACYCCCSCFAWGTRITVGPDTYRVVQSIALGDEVLTTKVTIVDGKPQLNWVSRAVTFSDGMAPSSNQSAVLLQYGDAGELVVTPDQPMLMADGTLKSADRITTDDYLVDHYGAPIKVAAAVLGKRTVGFHSLTTQDFNGPLHPEWFLETNGVVAGDHMVLAMQDADEVAAMYAKGHDDLPKIGTDDYAANARDAYSINAALSAEAREIATQDFIPLDELLTAHSPVPYGSTPYVTQKQAHDIAVNGTFRGLTETFLVNEFNYFTSLFKAFFPKVNFYLNWEDLNPNMFAFDAYGQQTVYMSGQLLRLNGMFKQGLVMMMAQGVARFQGTSITNDYGLQCTGPSDYNGANQVLQTLFYGDYMPWAFAGYQQIKALFSLINPENRIGHEVCATPSIPCRLETIDAAISGLQLPPCAGGPVIGALKLESAAWTNYENALAIKVEFNLRLRVSSAVTPRNYQLSDKMNSAVVIGLVQVDANDPSASWLIIDGDKPTEALTLTVKDIVSDNGSTLDPAASSTTVE